MNDTIAYHGADGNEILNIMAEGRLLPSSGKIFLSSHDYERVLSQGADSLRMACYAVKLSFDISGLKVERTATPGVPSTLVIHTDHPVPVQITEMYVRQPRASSVQTISGSAEITRYLTLAALGRR